MAEVAFETLLAAVLLFAMDALAHLKLTVGGFGILIAGWMIALVGARMAARGRPDGSWRAAAIELGLPLLWLGGANGFLKQPWSLGQVIYATLAVGLLWHGGRWLLRTAENAGCNRVAEAGRLFLVGLTAGGAGLPFFTDLHLGGTDGRWYTGVFIDFISQLRAGFFPVFVGQGELAFNGSVNLFRTAPLCLWLGGVCDLLTAQSLSPIAIRNLSVITAALGAGYGMYAALLRLRRTMLAELPATGELRWAAALIAMIYILCPSVLHALYYYELQMTFTALLALPWVFYGNVRTLHGTDGRGYLPLAVGLSLTWLAHAPLAIISMLVTAALQLGRYVFEPAAIVQWKAAAGGALLFCLLSSYYFLGVSELASGFGPGARVEAVFMVGIVLVVFGVVRLCLGGRWTGALSWLVGAALIGTTFPVWLGWVLAWGVLFGGMVLICRRTGVDGGGGRAVWWAAGAMLGAAALAGWWTTSRIEPANLESMKTLMHNAAVRSDLFLPVPPPAAMTDFGASQPGYAVWLLVILVGVGAWGLRNQALALLATVIGLLLVLILSVPLASDFIVAFAPRDVANLVTLPMLYRLVPPLAALIGLAGFLTLARLAQRHPGWLRWGVIALAVSAALSAWEAQKLVRYGRGQLATRHTTETAFSPHNYALGRYSFLMLVSPTAFIDGKQFAWLESRLLDARTDLLFGPEQLARQAEEAGSETLELTSRVDENSEDWLTVAPGWKVQPGETLLLRLEIAPGMNCFGYLILQSEHGYQEFHLTMNYSGTGFGLTTMASRVMSVTNPGNRIEHYTMRFKAEPGNTMPRDGRTWAKVHLSRYEATLAPVEVKSLMPYRARVTAVQPGYLEVPRQWLAGYRARVNGKPVPVTPSPGMFIKVPITAGTQTVEVSYVGSLRIWAGLLVSSATLLALLAWWFTGGWNRPRPEQRAMLQQWIQANKT